jgi:superfamily II DNA or RNA helicase
VDQLNAAAQGRPLEGLSSQPVTRPPVDAAAVMRAKGLRLVLPGAEAAHLKHFQTQCATAFVRYCQSAVRPDPNYCEALALAPPASGKSLIHIAAGYMLADTYSSVRNFVIVTSSPATISNYLRALQALRSDHFTTVVTLDWTALIAGAAAAAAASSSTEDEAHSAAAAATAATDSKVSSTAAGAEKPELRFVVVTMQQLVVVRAEARQSFDAFIAAADVFLVDEGHHYYSVTAPSWIAVLQQVRRHQHEAAIAATAVGDASQSKLKVMLGLTATPPSSDPAMFEKQRGLLFASNVVHTVPRHQLLQSGLIVPLWVLPEWFRQDYLNSIADCKAHWQSRVVADSADSSSSRAEAEQQYAVDWAKITAYYLQVLAAKYSRKRMQCFVSCIPLAELLAQQLQTAQQLLLYTSAGSTAAPTSTRSTATEPFDARAVYGLQSGREKAAVLSWMQSTGATSAVQCAVCVNMWLEGVDMPPLDCVLSTRRANNVFTEAQRTGRGQRASPGKTECLIGYLAPRSPHEASNYAPLADSLYHSDGSSWVVGRKSQQLVQQQDELERQARAAADADVSYSDEQSPEELAFDEQQQ